MSLTEFKAKETARDGGKTTLEDAKARIPSNVFWNWSAFAFNIGVAFLISPLLVHRLGDVEYGIWSLVGDFTAYSWLLGFGLGYAVMRYIARYYALDDKDSLNSTITTSFVLNFASSLLVMALALGVAYVFPRLFSIPENSVFAARMTVLLVAASVAAGFPASVFSGCLQAASRYDWVGIRIVASTGLRALLLWYFLERGYGLITVAFVTAIATLLGYAIDLFFARRQFPHLEIRWKHLDLSLLRPLMSFSAYALVLGIAARLIYATDNIVVGFVLGPAVVTFYAIGAKLPIMLRDSLGNITKLYFPFASHMDALGREDGLRRLFLAGTRIASLYVIPAALSLIILGPRFLDLWMGKPFGARSGPVLALLVFEVVFFGITSGGGQVLYGMNRHKFNAWLSLSNAGANLILSVILVHVMGIVGVAWGTAIPAAIAEGIILPVYTARLLHVPVRRFYYDALLRPVAAAIPLALWLWFSVEQGLVDSYGTLMIVTSLGLGLYALAAWRVGLDRLERDLALRWILDAKARLVAAFA